MFPSAGYFRSTNCPFFVHGLCHRPYCHFRHSKPGLKASKSKTSPHKGTNEEKIHTLTPTKTGVVPKLYSATTVVESKTETAALPKDATQDSDKSKVSTSAQLRGILKRSTSDEEDTKQKSSHTELPSVEDLNHIETKVTPQVTDNRNEDTLELDDSEPPFPSLTEEEKQIIGLPTLPENVNQSQTSCSEKNGDFQKVHVLNHDSIQTVYKDLSSENKVVKQGGDVGSRQGNHCISEVVQEGQAKEINETNSNETLPSQQGREEVIVDSAVDHTASPDGVNKDTKVTEEKSDRSSAMKRKSIKLEISSDGGSQNIPNDFLFNVPKKRKSQKLSCKNESFSQMKDLSAKEKGYGEAVVNPQATKQKTQYNSALFEKVCDSGKLLFDTKDKRKNKTISTLNEVMSDFGDAKTMKGKTVAKNSTLAKLDVPKKKAKVSEAGINFFSSSKKLGNQSKVDRKNMSSDFNISPSKTSKPRQSPPVKEIQQLKRVATKNIHVDTIRIDSTSDSSDVCSPVFSDSSPEEEEQLKRIWNDFEPDPITIEDKVIQSPVKKQPPVKSPSMNVTSNSVHGFEKADTGKQASLANTLGLGKKQRVAHATNHLPRRLSSNANPVRRYPKTLAAVHRQSVSAPGPSVESSSEASSNYASRKRVAHVPKSTSPAGTLPRPKIPVEYGAKVPQNQRQRYLDRIVDEYLRLCSNEKFAFEKAVEEEQVLYERSTRRQVYLNLCVNAIKKLRGLTHIEAPVESESTHRVAKTLTSGAVVISTVSPVKQQRVPSVSDQLTEEVLYDFLVKYLLNEEDLVENGYPRQCPTAPGKAVYKSRKEQPSKNSSWRTCRRCGKPFAVLEDGEYQTKEECIYHAGKLFRRRGEPITNYSCCQGDAGSPGCCVGKVHVCDAVCDPDGFMTTIVSPLRDNNNKVYAIDCEMCYTTAGLELTRITVVNWNLEQVYDSFVLPERRIVDYNTRFSGVTEESLRGVTTTIREIQAVLLSMIHKDTILVGHSLESDLKATKLIHSKVVDTSVVFPHRLGPPYKRALRNLMAEHLKKIIQDSVNGHDSHEDAAACLELMRWKVKEDIRKLTRPKGPLRSTHT